MKKAACVMMQRMTVFLTLVGLTPAVPASQVWFDDAGDLTSWGVSQKAAGYVTVEGTWADVDANGQEFWLSSWNNAATAGNGSWTDIWKGSGVTIQADLEYILSVKLGSWDSGLEGDEVGPQPAGAGDQVWIGMEDWTANVVLADSYLWPDNSNGDSQGYAIYSVSFNTYGGNNAASIGNEIGVSISSLNWWNNFSISEMSITAVPEPGALALIGLGSMALAAVWRRR